jgi:ABC-2 type transport system permease protein
MSVNNRYKRISALVRKETTQLLRDKRTLIFIISLPLIELLLFAYATALTVYHLPTAVFDQSHDNKSREFMQAMVNSQFFDPTLQAQSEEQVVQAIDAGQVRAGVIIPPDFSAEIERGDANVLILLDGSDNFSVSSGYSAASTVAQNFAFSLTTEKVTRMGYSLNLSSVTISQPIVTSFRILYNPDLKDVWFVLPGIFAMIMQTLAIAQAAMIVVREREVGTIEQILVTPTRPLELIVAKMIPLLVLCFGISGLILAVGVFWFGVPFQGSLWLYFIISLMFLTASLGLGLLISTIAKTQRQAQQISLMIMMFSMLLTGLVYPRSTMPWLPKAIGSLLPLTYFIRVSRGIITKGVGLSSIWSDTLILFSYGLVVMVIAALSFKKRLD